MSASGRLKAASGDCAGLQANRPRRSRFQPSGRSFAIGTKSGPAMRKKRVPERMPYKLLYCRLRRHSNSALSFDAEKEGAGCGASATGWRIGLILRAPCSAAARALPRKTTCGGFWYFWPQKYKKKKVCGNCDFPEPSQTFSVKFRKTFFSAFRWRKAAKATRPIPMAASGRLKAASGDYSRVCKQTVPAAVAFSPPSAFSPSEPSRDTPCGKRRGNGYRGALPNKILPPLAAQSIRTLV